MLKSCGDIETNPGPSGTFETKYIHIGHVNIRSLTAMVDDPYDGSLKVSKFELVKNHILFYEYDIFSISETWLDSTISNTDLMVSGYHSPYRIDCSRHQRGVLLYLSLKLPAKRRPDLEQFGSDIICVELQQHGTKCLICNCYRSPSSDIIQFCSDLDNILENSIHEFQDVICIGDMNARNSVFWENDVTNTDGRALSAYIQEVGMVELIHEPTRLMGNSRSCIDLILSNNPDGIISVGTRDKLTEMCDHKPIFAMLNYSVPKRKTYKRMVWNYNEGLYEEFRYSLLNAPWQGCYIRDDVNTSVQNWLDLFLYCAESCVPHYETTIRPCDKPFMKSHIRTLMRKRDRLYIRYKKTLNENAYSEYKHYRNIVVSEVRKAKMEFDANIDNKICNGSISKSCWWKVCKSSLGMSKLSSGGPLNANGVLVTDDNCKANILNDFFVSQSKLVVTSTPPELEPTGTFHISSIITQPEDIYKILSQLDTSKACGPDGIGNKLLKEAAVPLAQPLSELFNFILSIGIFPEVWKTAQVTALYKKGDPTECNNYRPISLLPCLSKVFEKVLFDGIFTFLKAHQLLNPRQSGFIPGDSTVNQLISVCHNISCHLDKGEEMVGVFLDLTKAFDRVWHAGLLKKLEQIGIRGLLFQIIKSYLTNRKQFVVVNGCKSVSKELYAGVPQGSVLGPLLFLVYINDISKDMSNSPFLYADDTSLFCPILNGDIDSTVQCINSDLEKIELWCKKWLVSISETKTVAMLFSRNRHPSNIQSLRLGNHDIGFVPSHKHLGMVFTSNFSWSFHIENQVTKCNKLIGMLRRFKYRWSRKALETCYLSFIRPVIEYCDIIYDNCSKGDSNKMDSMQLEAARLVLGAKRGTSHKAIYHELGWLSLSNRRFIHKLSKTYSIVNNLVPKYLHDIFLKYKLPSEIPTRAKTYNNFQIPLCKTNLHKGSIVVSSMTAWNQLEPKFKILGSLSCFKSNLNALYKVSKPLFNHKCSRVIQVAFTQIRLGFSNLRNDLYLKGCIPDAKCACGAENEDASHFFLRCPNYTVVRNKMKNRILNICGHVTLSAAICLYGSEKFNHDKNMQLFDTIYQFIIDSKRF